MRRSLSLGALLCAVITCASVIGCGPQGCMMPAPLANREAGLARCRQVPVDRRTTSVPVFYATNRVRCGEGDCGPTYESTRCNDLRLGSASVRIGPESWDFDRLTQETLRGAQPPMTVTRVEEFGVLASGGSRFAEEINRALGTSTQKDIFIYVPGINIGFDMILQRVAEFSHYASRDGVFMAYAWPSHPHPFSYDEDLRCACDSVESFTELIRFLQDHTDARKIHLLASSAGAPVISGALTAFRTKPGASPPRLGQVVYAAPDQDTDAFRNLLSSGHADACEHITVYSSSTDLGLILSLYLGGGKQTLGRLPANLTDSDAALLRDHADRVTVVDATEAVEQAGRGDIWAHRYWYANPWVTSDLLAVLQSSRPPAARGLVPSHDGALWAFPTDYPERLRQTAAP